jgi:hypothetical protein
LSHSIADISMTAIGKIPKTGHPIDHDLPADVAKAVTEAAEDGTTTRADIVRRFDGRASRAKIYSLIAREIEKRGIAALGPVRSAAPIQPKAPPPTIQAEVEDIEEHARSVVERAEHAHPTDKPIDMVAELHGSIAHCDLLMRMAMDSEGKIRNARLAAVSIDLKGRAIERLSRVRTSLEEESQQAEFLRQVGQAIMAEPPEIRARILGRLRTINASWGL